MIDTNISPVSFPDYGHLHISPKGYITWEAESKWDNVKKQPAGKRISIGKVADKEKRLLYPNKNFYRIFPEQKPGNPPAHSSVLAYAPFLALRTSAEKSGCLEALTVRFPECADQILAVAIHDIVTEDNTAIDFPYWYYHNYCGLHSCLYDSHISELYQTIGSSSERIKNFLYDFRQQFRRRSEAGSKTVLAFDSTNQNTYCSDNFLAEHGKAKVNEGIPDINTAMFVDEQTGIPLYYEHFYGSILDKSETPVTLEKAEDLGYSKIFLMLDRGYADKECAEKLAEFEYGLMLPEELKKAKELIRIHGPQIKDKAGYYIASEETYGMKLPEKQNILGQSVSAYVFYDPLRGEKEKRAILHKVNAFKENLIKKRKRYSEKLKDQYKKWLIIEEKKDHEKGEAGFTVEINLSSLQEQLDKAGMFMIISDTEISAEEMIRIARCRDRVEKGFKDLKQHLDMEKTYTHHRETYEGKMFVSFIALIIREAYRWYLRDWFKTNNTQTTHTSLGELSKYEIEQKQNEEGWLARTAMTRRQKEIFDALGLTAKDLKASIMALTLA